MASFLFDEGAKQLLKGGSITFGSDTIKTRLVDAGVTPSRTATVMTGITGISTDKTLSTCTVTKDTTNHRQVFDADDPATWSGVASGSTIGWLVIYKFGTNDADSIPIACVDITDVPTNGGDITITWPATGIFYLQE